MAIEITRATQADACGLTACIDAAYADYLDRGLQLPPVSEGVAEEIETALVWVARKNEIVVGGVVLSTSDGVLYLRNIAVRPEFGGQGIGQALMQVAKEFASEAGCKTMRLTTHADMPENVAFYERLGWRVTRRIGQKVEMEHCLPVK